MDDGLARAEDVMSSQRAHNARVACTLKIFIRSRPREVPFLFVTFSLGKQRESSAKRRRVFGKLPIFFRLVTISQHAVTIAD